MKQHKQLIIFAAIIVVVIGASVAAALLLGGQEPASKQAKNDDKNVSGLERPAAEKKADEVNKIAHEGSVDDGVKAYDEAIANTDDSHEKFIYYSEKATLLLNNDRPEDALPAAKKAVETEPNSSSAAFVAQIAVELGDTGLAREYYQKAIDLIDPADPMGKNDKAYYQAKLDELGGV